MIILIWAGDVAGQTSLFGGVNVNLNENRPFSNIRYFGGTEIKIGLSEWFRFYLAPQYQGLTEDGYRIETAVMPAGVSFQINEMWDERTILFRFIDISLGAYGGYFFDVKIKSNGHSLAEEYAPFDYGISAGTKIRLFIFYPLYLNYTYSIAYLVENGNEKRFHPHALQFGIYFPLSDILRDY